MELSKLEGRIIGVISDNFQTDDFLDKLVSDIIIKKVPESLKMVQLENAVLDKRFRELSLRDKSKVILASKLHDQEIVLVNFSKGLTFKDFSYFKTLFKKIVTYGRRIILVDIKSELFLNCVDKIYVIEKDEVKYVTADLFDKILELYIDAPKIVEFFHKCEKMGVRLDQYTELDELMKAIYRIKA